MTVAAMPVAAAPAQPGNSPTHTFRSHDDTELFYRHWPATRPSGKTLILFHRGHEHSNRWDETVKRLALEDVDVFAWDQRGHGNSPGDRGSAQNISVVIKDADGFARHLQKQHGVKMQETVVIAHSVGAVIAAAWVHDFAPPLRGLILGTPALRVKLYVPFAVPALRLKQKLLGPGYVKSYVKAKMVTHDREQAAAYKADPQIFPQIATNILLDLYDVSTRLMADAGAITVPTLMLVAEKDWVVKIDAQWKFFERLSSPIKQLEVLPGFYHAIFHEKERAKVVDRCRTFITECFNRSPESGSMLDADYTGYTRAEYDRLRLPGGMKWKITRLMLKSFGSLSDGIRLGHKEGFDSGVMLDYVYRNQPGGKTFLGRAIDKNYLNSIGWRGIRIRRENLQKVLRRKIELLHSQDRRIHIVDIAAGPGRYVLETIKSIPEIPITALVRDYKPVNVEAAQKLIAELGLTGAQAQQGDAFNREELAKLDPRPTIGIISGLFELFPENAPLKRALSGMADAIEPGGYLIYTCQPWHPQVEFIARALTNREGQPWIMRRRTTQEMDQLVAAAGFEKLSMEIDPWGIFTVSVARRS